MYPPLPDDLHARYDATTHQWSDGYKHQRTLNGGGMCENCGAFPGEPHYQLKRDTPSYHPATEGAS